MDKVEIIKEIKKVLKSIDYIAQGACLYCKGEWNSTDFGKHEKKCPMGKLERIVSFN